MGRSDSSLFFIKLREVIVSLWWYIQIGFVWKRRTRVGCIYQKRIGWSGGLGDWLSVWRRQAKDIKCFWKRRISGFLVCS